MTGRKPPGTDWESWIDQLIRESEERGEFDELAGKGKPIAGLDKPHDEMWWVRKKLASEGVSYLPPALELRKDKEDTLSRLASEGSEQAVRELIGELNSRIRTVNRTCIDGPPSNVMPVDVEQAVESWRAMRAVAAEHGDAQAAVAAPARPTPASPGLLSRLRAARRRHQDRS